jgi:sugar phosphate isomerase/epimerase
VNWEEGDIVILGYSSMTAGIFAADAAFALADRQGLRFVELSFDVEAFLPAAQPARRVRELSQATGIFTTLHLPFLDLNPASLHEGVRRFAVAELSRSLEYASAIGARCVVAHTGTRFPYQPRAVADSVAALEASLAELADSPVPIVLENLALFADGVLRGPEMLDAVTRRAGLKNCLDFAHAFLECRATCCAQADGPDLVRRYIETLGDNIAHLHLCNTDGRGDTHAPTPDGVLPYPHYAGFLQSFGGTVCLEVSGGEDGVARSAAQLRAITADAITADAIAADVGLPLVSQSRTEPL